MAAPAQRRDIFLKLGESHHFKIDNHSDLEALLELDEALWVATTAPCSTLKTDPVFLTLLDADHDGRLRAEEIKDGIRHLFSHLTEVSAITPGNDELTLSSINTGTELGQRIRTSADKVLKRLNSKLDQVSLQQVRAVQQEVLQGGLDQAGIVLSEAADSEEMERCIKDILASVGGRDHPNGSRGVDKSALHTFLDQCSNYLDWYLKAGSIKRESISDILPLGANTEDGYELLQNLAPKLNQYFLLCDIKRLNPELLSRAFEVPEANIAYNLIRIEEAESYLSSAPLSLLSSDGTLDLTGEINPYFEKILQRFLAEVIEPLLGKKTQQLDRDSFHRLQQIFEPYEIWVKQKPEVQVDRLDAERISGYVSDPAYRQRLEELISRSHETAFVLDNLKELERLILYQAHILPLVNSFVSFPHLYDPNERALFEEGTLIMDGRHFTMAVKVEDRQHHIETSRGSNIFVIYCELFGPDGKKMYEIAVPVTSGSRGNLRLHKWGIFNDINGHELHAKIVDIVENPISIGEAVIDPFIRMRKSFFSRLEQFSSKAEERLFRKKEDDEKKKDAASGTMLAGISVAVAALGSSAAFITKTVSAMSFRTVLLALLVIALLILVPTALSAYYRLSRRDLSSILEGSGWGLNARMKLTSSQANHFTHGPGQERRAGSG